MLFRSWETARRRDDGNDWVHLRLAARGIVHIVELDTSHFKGNAPGWASLSVAGPAGEWTPLLDRVRLQPDTRHLFRVADRHEATQARLDVYPDGGMARMRLWGALTDEGRRLFVARWSDRSQ